MTQNVDARHKRLLRYLSQTGMASVGEFSARLGVSEMTIRRDLSTLSSEGKLVRFRGGAVLPTDWLRLIAGAAVCLVEVSDTLLLDTGPLSTRLAQQLASRTDTNCTVITRSLDVIAALQGACHVTLISLGGVVDQAHCSLAPTQPDDYAIPFYVEKTFLEVSAVSAHSGLFCAGARQAELRRCMIAAAREVIVLVHGLGTGPVAMERIAPVTAAHRIVTDTAIPAQERIELARMGVQIMVPRAG
jgi:DeoR/GlpR family transcriptional regulator of sugar metabolism